MDSAYEYAMRIGEIFLPTATHRRRAVSPSTRFVHYTTAEAAFEIVEKGRFWMRNVRNMNDYREVQHGYDILHDVFHRVKDEFISVLDDCCDGAAMTAINHFDK